MRTEPVREAPEHPPALRYRTRDAVPVSLP